MRRKVYVRKIYAWRPKNFYGGRGKKLEFWGKEELFEYYSQKAVQIGIFPRQRTTIAEMLAVMELVRISRKEFYKK